MNDVLLYNIDKEIEKVKEHLLYLERQDDEALKALIRFTKSNLRGLEKQRMQIR